MKEGRILNNVPGITCDINYATQRPNGQVVLRGEIRPWKHEYGYNIMVSHLLLCSESIFIAPLFQTDLRALGISMWYWKVTVHPSLINLRDTTLILDSHTGSPMTWLKILGAIHELLYLLLYTSNNGRISERSTYSYNSNSIQVIRFSV